MSASLSDGKRPSTVLQLFKKFFSFFITFTPVKCFAYELFLYDEKAQISDEKIEPYFPPCIVHLWKTGEERNKQKKKLAQKKTPAESLQ